MPLLAPLLCVLLLCVAATAAASNGARYHGNQAHDLAVARQTLKKASLSSAAAAAGGEESCVEQANFCGDHGVCVTDARNVSKCFCEQGWWHHPHFNECVEKPPATAALTSFCCLCITLALGKCARFWLKPLQLLYLPASVLGGTIALLLIQLSLQLNEDFYYRVIDRQITTGWDALPPFLINIVFAALFLGTEIPSPKVVWRQAKYQIVFGYFVAFHQWFQSLFITAALLMPAFGVSKYFGLIIGVGYAGGHGTAGGLSDSFKQVDYSEGIALSLGTATVGLLSSVLVGVLYVNIAARVGLVKEKKMATAVTSKLALRGVHSVGRRPVAGYLTVSTDSIDALSLHLAVLGVAISCGYGLKMILLLIEAQVRALEEYKILSGVPVFMLSMLCGAVIQKILQRFNRRTRLIDKALMSRLSGVSLDFLVVAAMGTVEVGAIGKAIAPFLIVCIWGVAIQSAMLFFGARWFFGQHHWFENGISVFGQSMGVVASGLLLLRMVDPNCKTGIMDAFGYRQLLHAPFLGGGLFTALSLPLMSLLGIWGMVSLTFVFMLLTGIWCYFIRRARRAEDRLKEAAGVSGVFSDAEDDNIDVAAEAARSSLTGDGAVGGGHGVRGSGVSAEESPLLSPLSDDEGGDDVPRVVSGPGGGGAGGSSIN